jgi:hypothetical protein
MHTHTNVIIQMQDHAQWKARRPEGARFWLVQVQKSYSHTPATWPEDPPVTNLNVSSSPQGWDGKGKLGQNSSFVSLAKPLLAIYLRCHANCSFARFICSCTKAMLQYVQQRRIGVWLFISWRFQRATIRPHIIRLKCTMLPPVWFPDDLQQRW